MRALAAILALWLLPLAGSASPFLGPKPPASPRRVVTLAPSLTEIVLDLGEGGRLVGVTRYDDAPEVRELPRVGGFVDPSPEAILRLEPDLLIVQPGPGNREVVERLARLGVPVLVVPLNTLEEIFAGVEAVAEALGRGEKGRKLRAELRARIEALRTRAAALPRVRTLVVYGWQPLVVAGPGSYADELLRIAGGENVASGLRGAFPTIPAERALRLPADRVIDTTMEDGAQVALPGWEGKVVPARSRALVRPGPRVIESLEELFQILHGEEP